MRQNGPLRLHARDPAERLLEMAVRRVRIVTQAVDDPELDAGERREGRLVELDDVGRVRDGSDAESERPAEAVILLERNDAQPGDLERPVDDMRYGGRLVEGFAGLQR